MVAIRILIAAVLGSAALAVSAQVATYNGSTGLLTLPAVKVGSATYASVTLLNIGSYTFRLQTVTDQVPPGPADATYDGATGVLSIPTVVAGDSTYVNVALFNTGNYTFSLQRSSTVSSISVVSPTLSPKEGESVQLSGFVWGPGGDIIPEAKILWSTSDPSVATVSASGLVRALTQGNVVITAAVNSVSGSRPLTVIPVPAPAQAAVSASEATISNSKLSIRLDAASGSIKSIIDVASGQNLVSGTSGYRALWGLNLAASGTAARPFADNNSSGKPTITANNSATQATLTLVWTGLNANSGLSIPGAKVTVEITLNSDEPTSQWSFSAENLGSLVPSELLFPLISGVGILDGGGSDRLAIPEGGGRLYDDPVGQRLNWARNYPSAHLNMQFAAYYGSHRGFMLGTRDTEGYTKTFQWFSPSSSPQASIWQALHYLNPVPVGAIALPYKAVLGVFGGDWTAAANLYRSWARNQIWSQQAGLQTLPAWLRQAGYATSLCAHNCGFGPSADVSFSTIASRQTAASSSVGPNQIARLDGWEKYGAWYYGDWFPPYEGWQSFDQAVNQLHQQGQRLHILISGQHLDSATALWQTPAAQDAAMKMQDGSPLGVDIQIGQNAHHWNLMSPTSTFWRQNLSDAVTTLASHGADSIQFDGWPFFDPPDDYSAGHPPGKGGNWQWQAWKQLFIDVEAAGRSIRPDLAFASEGIHELAIPYITTFVDRDAMKEVQSFESAGAPIPLFAYVYAPLIQSQAENWLPAFGNKPDSYHRLALARAFLRGQRVQLPSTPWISDPAFSSAIASYTKALSTARIAFQRFLLDGTMLPAPITDAPAINVSIEGDGFAVGSYSGTSPAVLASAWRASNGETGIVLTNISTESLNVSFPVDFVRLGLTPGWRYSVNLTNELGTRLLTSASESHSLAVQIAPLQVVLVSLQ